MSTNFAIIGPSGYIAKRHLSAVQKLNGRISAYLDLKTSNFQGKESNTKFFDNEHDFSDYLSISEIDYLIVCSPNYLHLRHIKLGLSANIDVICEKPIVLSMDDFNELEELESHSKASVFTIYQLRLHDINNLVRGLIRDDNTCLLTYVARRDEEYYKSWKVDENKSGGILFNLGIHYFDFLISHFGVPSNVKLNDKSAFRASGEMQFNNLHAEWLFSIDPNDLSPDLEVKREFTINGNDIDFSGGFKDLHFESYKNIFDGSGYGLSCAKPSIEIVDRILRL